MSASMINLERARWRGGPKICPIANLPSFPTLGDLYAFRDRLGGTDLLKWRCQGCEGWHYWAKPWAPAGSSSGTARAYHVPERILELVERTAVHVPIAIE